MPPKAKWVQRYTCKHLQPPAFEIAVRSLYTITGLSPPVSSSCFDSTRSRRPLRSRCALSTRSLD